MFLAESIKSEHFMKTAVCGLFSLNRKFNATEAFICQAFRDEAVISLPQVPDNAANGRFGQHPKGENFLAKKRKIYGYKLYLGNYTIN